MKYLKITLNCILSFLMPGILLISRKQVAGYFIYLLYLIQLFVSFFTGFLFSSIGPKLILIVWFILIVSSIFFYLSNLKLRNNRKTYLVLAILTLSIQFTLFMTKTNNNLFHIRTSASIKSINHKIDYLESLVSKHNPFTPDFLNGYNCIYQGNIPVKPRLNEYLNWKSGIYYMISKDTTLIAHLNAKCGLVPYPNLQSLLKELSVQHINIDTIPFYFTYSTNLNTELLKTSLLTARQLGIKSVKGVYIKDSNNVEHLAFDSIHVSKVKYLYYKLIGEGKSPAEALAAAIQPSVKTCPPFMVDLDSLTYISADKRFAAVILSFRKNANCNNCNIKDAIDIGYLLSVPWVSYSIVEYDLDKVISGIQRL